MMRRWYLSLAENSTQRDWRRVLVHHYLDVPLRFHRERPTGDGRGEGPHAAVAEAAVATQLEEPQPRQRPLNGGVGERRRTSLADAVVK